MSPYSIQIPRKSNLTLDRCLNRSRIVFTSWRSAAGTSKYCNFEGLTKRATVRQICLTNRALMWPINARVNSSESMLAACLSKDFRPVNIISSARRILTIECNGQFAHVRKQVTSDLSLLDRKKIRVILTLTSEVSGCHLS